MSYSSPARPRAPQVGITAQYARARARTKAGLAMTDNQDDEPTEPYSDEAVQLCALAEAWAAAVASARGPYQLTVVMEVLWPSMREALSLETLH